MTTTPDEAKLASLTPAEFAFGRLVESHPRSPLLTLKLGFDAGHASRDAEVEALQAEVEAAKADRNERHEKVVEFMDKYEASRAQVERLTKAARATIAVLTPVNHRCSENGCPYCAAVNVDRVDASRQLQAALAAAPWV